MESELGKGKASAASVHSLLFDRAPLREPVDFAQYKLLERVGQGGMAAVYRAMRHSLHGFEKAVAIKIMLPDLADQRAFVDLFNREAKICAQLAHPNIIQVNDFGIASGLPFLEMEWISGLNLSQLLRSMHERKVKLPPGVALRIARDFCMGLGWSHSRVDEQGAPSPIIHRDISLTNVMVSGEGAVKVLDFGVAKVLHRRAEASSTLKGKFGYMAPELMHTKEVTPRTDVFAAGVVLYEILTGRRLFGGKSDLETIKKLTEFRIVPPSQLVTGIPKSVDDVVLKALAQNPNDRYADGGVLAEAIEALPALGTNLQFRQFVSSQVGAPAPPLAVPQPPQPPQPQLRIVRTPANGIAVPNAEPESDATEIYQRHDGHATAPGKPAVAMTVPPTIPSKPIAKTTTIHEEATLQLESLDAAALIAGPGPGSPPAQGGNHSETEEPEFRLTRSWTELALVQQIGMRRVLISATAAALTLTTFLIALGLRSTPQPVSTTVSEVPLPSKEEVSEKPALALPAMEKPKAEPKPKELSVSKAAPVVTAAPSAPVVAAAPSAPVPVLPKEVAPKKTTPPPPTAAPVTALLTPGRGVPRLRMNRGKVKVMLPPKPTAEGEPASAETPAPRAEKSYKGGLVNPFGM